MTDREILDRYTNFNNSYLTDKEKIEVWDLLYEYKDAFSFRDEIGTCPNIEVEIDVTDKTPFSIRPYHAKEEDKLLWTRKWSDYVTWVSWRKVFLLISAQ